MAKYTVEQDFTDKNTRVVYRQGQEYPIEGVSEVRIAELLGDDHQFHVGALISESIEEAPDDIDLKPTNDNTVAQIISYLDDNAIEHDGLTKKQDLLDLI